MRSFRRCFSCWVGFGWRNAGVIGLFRGRRGGGAWGGPFQLRPRRASVCALATISSAAHTQRPRAQLPALDETLRHPARRLARCGEPRARSEALVVGLPDKAFAARRGAGVSRFRRGENRRTERAEARPLFLQRQQQIEELEAEAARAERLIKRTVRPQKQRGSMPVPVRAAQHPREQRAGSEPALGGAGEKHAAAARGARRKSDGEAVQRGGKIAHALGGQRQFPGTFEPDASGHRAAEREAGWRAGWPDAESPSRSNPNAWTR